MTIRNFQDGFRNVIGICTTMMLSAVLLLCGCYQHHPLHRDTPGDTGQTESDTGAENSDGDSDSDSGGDSDSDSGGDSDSDSDEDSDSDSGGDSDSDSGGDGNSNEMDSDVMAEAFQDWVRVPAGTFWMGTPDGACPEEYPGGSNCVAEPGRDADENLHFVELTNSYLIMATEVTQALFVDVVGWNPSYFSDCGHECPVNDIRWNDAVVFANAYSERLGLPACYHLADMECQSGTHVTKPSDCMNRSAGGVFEMTASLNNIDSIYECEGVRLPTEAEWEYAARANSYTAFHPSANSDGEITQPIGQNESLDAIGWYEFNSAMDGVKTPHPVATLAPNAFGIYDMSGNTYEWVWDWHSSTYPRSGINEPLVNPEGPQTGTYRVLRGGAMDHPAFHARSGHRGIGWARDRSSHRGFRLAITVDDDASAVLE
ncbi:MAG: SUMF1/EgtB/PvdO family nonheme iron enzyme [Deltaproteobacteria bacterium]|nr:SUMF1/EgtB/PvdO family nonheme iron enzyme [Deltaproteobacteria bacterium]